MKSPARSAFFVIPLLLTALPACVADRAASHHKAGPQPVIRKTAPLSQVSRASIMATAMRYADHAWTGSEANVKHGPDKMGIMVDTPDFSYQKTGAVPGYWIPGQVNHGIPYQWGGFSSPEEFDRGLAAGLAAGDVYTEMKRARLLEAVSTEAVGIDCSGFVSRCWGLPRSYSTRELAALCDSLPSWEDLRPGDALNTYNAHVVLFSGWIGKDREFVAVYETGGPPDWKVMRHVISTGFLKRRNYQPLRYRGVTES